MRSILGVCLIALGVWGFLRAQDPAKPVLREGIYVEMATVNHAVAIPAADAVDATAVTVTSDGKIFVGTQPIELSALAGVPASTVYVKADARAPYQRVLTVLETLQGHSLALLTAPTVKPEAGKIAPPYGVVVTMRGGAR